MFNQFLRCHIGKINVSLHVIGLAMLAIGVLNKSLAYVLIGAVIQELGHFYQYSQAHNLKDSPLACLKPQLIFVYPIFLLIIIYVLMA